MSGQVRVGGIWLATLGGVGSLRYSHVADGGCEQASWEMDLDPAFTHPSIVSGKLVEIREGPANVWSGSLAEPDRSGNGITFSAAGLAADLRDRLALDGAGNTTSKPDTAIDTAIANGLPVTRPASLSNASYAGSDSTDDVNKTGDLLNAWSDFVAKRWGVNADRQVYAATDPTTPVLHLVAGSVKVGLADDDYASDLYGRYKTGPSSYDTVHVSDPIATLAHRREVPVDLTPLGVITQAKATAVLNGILAKGKARYSWTEALEVSQEQLIVPGGQPAYLPFVTAGVMARAFGVITEQGYPLPHLDFIIGRTEHQPGSKTITISPVQMATRSLADIIAAAVGA